MKKEQSTKATERGSREAKQATAVILETLAGLSTTGEAAERLGVSPARYYQLEARALEGMMAALEPRRRGRQTTPEGRIKALVAEKAELERELRRHQSLLRQASRSLGLKARPKAKPRRGGARTSRTKTVLKTLRQDLGGASDGATKRDDAAARPDGRESGGA